MAISERPLRPSAFTTEAQAEFRRRNSRRLLWAAGITLLLLGVLILLGPNQQEIKRRFEYYGAPDELRIMPEVSIEDGRDRMHQLPRSLSVPPPPANLEIEREKPDPEGTVEVPPQDQIQPRQVDQTTRQPDPDSEMADQERVELSLPMQSNPDWFILTMVRPEYPIDAREEERQMPVVFVKAAVFVGPSGDVVERMILATNGGRAFSTEVLNALEKWKFGWRVEPGAGRWIEMIWNFRSPYFIGGRSLLPRTDSP